MNPIYLCLSKPATLIFSNRQRVIFRLFVIHFLCIIKFFLYKFYVQAVPYLSIQIQQGIVIVCQERGQIDVCITMLKTNPASISTRLSCIDNDNNCTVIMSNCNLVEQLQYVICHQLSSPYCVKFYS